MDYLALQNEILSDRFAETKRASAKGWINHRYGRMWAQEAWTFKLSTASIALGLGVSSVALGNFQRILTIVDATTSPRFVRNEPIRPEDFHEWSTLTSGVPVGYTVIGSNILFDAPAAAARTYTVLGELKYTALSADGDTPLIPEEFHMTLAHGAISEGLRKEQDPTWQAEEEDFRAGIEDMKKAYLSSVRNYQDFYPSWP